MYGKTLSGFLAALCLPLFQADAAEPVPLLETSELKGFSELSEGRRNLIEAAIEAGKEVSGMPYLYGGNGAEDGGFDCSGAMYHVLRKAGLKPPRTSYGQFLWVKEKSFMNLVSRAATDSDDPSFSHLKPGDLVFWSGTYEPKDDRLVQITHVAIFLGYEKKDGRAVMINATDGRSYRGKKGNGYGVYDFRVPRKGSKSRLVGYGTPPGLGYK
jgi:cell wall-associated NlpC family hydrolase